jgi:hypothetical protein
MTEQYVPRFPYVDAALFAGAIPNFQGSIANALHLIEADSTKLAQTRYSGIASGWDCIGVVRYALGHPVEEVRTAFARSVEAEQRVFELRGTDPAFPVTVITIENPKCGPGEPLGTITDQRPLNPSGSKDYSLTNSRGGLRSVYLALIAGDFERAEKIASMLWDPPDAGYLKAKGKFEICTPNDMHLAYAFRELLAGNKPAAINMLGKIRLGERDPQHIKLQAAMIRALITRSDGDFLPALNELLEQHQRRANARTAPECCLCIPALGLAIMALKTGLITPLQLPQDNPYLPMELAQVF